MGSSGCALCAEVFARGKLTPHELEVIDPLLTSTTLDPSFLCGLRESSSVFCDECRNLLRETKRLHELLQTITSQLDSLLTQVKVKYAGRSAVRVKVEDEYDESESGSSLMGFLIHPENENSQAESSVWVKEEEESEDDSSSSLPGSDPLNLSDEEYSSSDNQMAPPTISHKRRATNCALNESRQPPPRRKKLKSGKHFWSCALCDLKFFAKEEKFLHDETIHLAGASEVDEATMRLYSLVCGKSSMTPRDLSTHNELFHAAHLTFLCFSCDPPRKFFSEDLLNAHDVIHSPRPFGCSLCSPGSLTFETSSELDVHLVRLHTHSVHRQLDCPPEDVGKECVNPPISGRHGGTKILPPCRFCGLKVKQTGLHSLRLHERKKHPEKFIHLCSHVTCRKSFAEEKELLTCQESHVESPGHFKCFVCNGRFDDGATLREHLAAKHTEGGVKCDLCDESLVFDWALRVHKAKLHGGEWPFKCPICGKGAQHKVYMDEHLRSVHGEQESALLSCNECDRKFRTRISLNTHKRKEHKGLGIFTCEECGKVLRKSTSFEIHRKAHLGIKDHVCHTCGKAFVNPAVLKMHLRVHTGEKPFVCHVCQKGFSQRTPLVRHLDLHKKNGTWKEKPPKASATSVT